MQLDEPAATALLFTALAVLFAISALLTRAAERVRVPVPLLFLVIGMLAGSEGIGRIDFESYRLAFRVGSAALMLILFDGGLNTPITVIKQVLRPSATLASLGVVGTAGLVAVFANALGVPWSVALLLGSVVSSTDAAAVFSVLRSSGIHLKRRVGGTLEVESGINDPVAVILTVLLTSNLVAPDPTPWWRIVLDVVMQMVFGGVIGLGIGYGGRFILNRYRLPTSGIYPVLTLAFALLAFGAPTLVEGSGFLAVYVAGVILGNGPMPYRGSLLRVHDALAWLGQVAMFLMLGLLVFPSRLVEVAWLGLALALFLAVFARPLVVALCLLPFRYPLRDVVYVGWVGLRGAVPIVLATYPVLAGAPGAERLFNLVFFIVVVNAIVPGMTVPWVTRRLDLESADPPAPQAVLGIESLQPLNGELLSFYVDEALAVCGALLSELPFPSGAAVTLIVRGRELVPPKGDTRLESGDHVYIFTHPEDVFLVRLMFGRPEAD